MRGALGASPNRRLIGEARKVVLWHSDLRTSKSFPPETRSIVASCLSPDGGGFSAAATMFEFRREQQDCISEFHFREGAVPDRLVMSLSFSGNSEKLIAGFYFGKVRVWGLTNGTLR